MRGVRCGVKKADTWRYALLWARPMNAYPISATLRSAILSLLFVEAFIERADILGERLDLVGRQLVLEASHAGLRHAVGDDGDDRLQVAALVPLAIGEAHARAFFLCVAVRPVALLAFSVIDLLRSRFRHRRCGRHRRKRAQNDDGHQP